MVARTVTHVCAQGEETIEDCKRQNIVYESLCKECNPNKAKQSDPLMDNRDFPSIYVGESSRTLHERSSEHFRDYRKNAEESHMIKHWSTHHKNSSKPPFIQRVVRSYKSALERQVGESVRIHLVNKFISQIGIQAYESQDSHATSEYWMVQY